MVIVNNGVNRVRDLLYADLYRGKLGTNDTAPAESDTDLVVGESTTYLAFDTTSYSDKQITMNYLLNSALGNSIAFGGASTQFDITNPSGTTFRYTFDGTGTDPLITANRPEVGDSMVINGQNFNAANNGTFVVTASGANYFEVTNASGVVESNKTLGTGSLTMIPIYKEFGIYTNSASPVLLSRDTFTDITKDATKEINISTTIYIIQD